MTLAEEEHGTDLVPANGALAAVAQIEEIERLLPEALERGDTDWLLSVARKADVAALWAKREGYREEANRVGRLKVRAEACLGLLDTAPTLGNPIPPLMYGETMIPGGTRRRWRQLSIALERGLLDAVMDDIEASAEAISTTGVSDEIGRRAGTLVPKTAVRAMAARVASAEGVTIAEMARRAGLSPGQRSGIYTNNSERVVEARVEWRTAKAIAEALGEDPTQFAAAVSAVAKRGKRQRTPRWLTRERKPSKGPAGAAYTLFRQTLAEIATFAPNAVTKYDDIYAHLYAVEEFLAKEMKREGMA